jgi:hypothetical protein
VGVEPGRDEQQLGLERAHGRLDELVERAEVVVVVGAGRQRDVQRRLVPLARPARSREERPLVQRDVEDARVVPEDGLRSVAVVDVPVDDRDPLRLVGPRRDRDAVDEAEAHLAVRERVVSRRPDEREASCARGLDRCAGREQRRLPRRLRGDRARVEPDRLAQCSESVQVLARVTAKNVVESGRRGLHEARERGV